MATKLIAPAGTGGTVQGRSGLTYVVASDGTISNVAVSDVGPLLTTGWLFAVQVHRSYNTPGAPAAASAAAVVSSTNLSAGSLTVAAQPDVARQLAVLINSGTSTLTGAIVALTYSANDGTTQTDNLSAAVIQGNQTLYTTKGVEHLTSAVVSAVVGGNSPGVQIGTNATIALPVDPNFVDFAVTKETKITPTNGTLGLSVPADETVGTVTASGALLAPTTAPDGTHQYNVDYTYTFAA